MSIFLVGAGLPWLAAIGQLKDAILRFPILQKSSSETGRISTPIIPPVFSRGTCTHSFNSKHWVPHHGLVKPVELRDGIYNISVVADLVFREESDGVAVNVWGLIDT